MEANCLLRNEIWFLWTHCTKHVIPLGDARPRWTLVWLVRDMQRHWISTPPPIFAPTTTFSLSHSMTWFSSTTWSAMADLWVTLLSLSLEARVCVPAVKESTFLCSLILRPNFLPVSPMYELEQFLQGTQYRLNRSSPHRWPCPSDEPQSSVAFGEDG